MAGQLDVKKVQEDVNRIKQFIDAIEKLGGKMPRLKNAVNRLQIAIDTGADLVEATDETSRELSAYTEDLYRACEGAEEPWSCKARIDSKYQARSVEWTLSWKKKDSVVRRFVRMTLCRYGPKFIAKRLQMCRAAAH